ncbi:MAG: hypothetical protein Crog4KO_29080 [Crocinitomicaceae bacterium]
MELQRITKFTLLICGGIIFNLLFWKEQLGINLLLFSSLLLAIGLITSKDVRKSKSAWISVAGVLLTGVMVLLHHSFAARFVHFISLIVFIGFLSQPQLKAVFHAIAASILNALELPKSIALEAVLKTKNRQKMKKRWRWVKLIVIPWVVFWIFYWIFYGSNPVFAAYCDRIWNVVFDILESIFKDLSVLWIVQLIFGMAVVGLVLFRSSRKNLSQYEDQLMENIERKRKPRPNAFSFTRKTVISLKNEYKSALLLIASINLLLLVINVIDINWIWFNFEYDGTYNLSQFVHEGTYLLILSILLSMGILLYFFRRNLNFFPNNIWLRRLANAWIFQNAILVVSVIVRNYHYMYHFGLAYKRIGVMFFLCAVIIGLITLYIKINKAKTSFYLLKVNSWAVYGLLLLLSLVNWDGVIVKHNIKYTHEVRMDVEFLMSLSDKTLPILYENKDKLRLSDRRCYYGNMELQLYNRINQFMANQRKISWKSWNHADAKAFEYFESKGK